jgi:hypothetical protein
MVFQRFHVGVVLLNPVDLNNLVRRQSVSSERKAFGSISPVIGNIPSLSLIVTKDLIMPHRPAFNCRAALHQNINVHVVKACIQYPEYGAKVEAVAPLDALFETRV